MRLLCLSLISSVMLGACGGAEQLVNEDNTTPDTMETAEVTDLSPFDTLLPWDPEADGVETTESGLQYLVLREGPEGGEQATDPRDRVTVMYDGRLTTGEKFDSSYDRGSPATFQLNQVISGWTEGLQLMSEGDEFMFYIPSALGYGDSPRPGGVIKPGDDLIFRVELEKVQKAPPPVLVDEAAFAAYVPWDSTHEEVQKTGSGLEYIILESGKEDGVSPEAEDLVAVHYEGRYNADNTAFDSSFERGEPALFPAGQLIPGWVEALQIMKPGDRWLVYIPSDLAYGPAGKGPIPPDSDLVFEVSLLDVMKVQ